MSERCAPPAIVPLMVSQKTVESIFGVDPRRFLELVRDHAADLCPTKVGKLRIVSVSRLHALLDRLASSEVVGPALASASVEPETADDVLSRIGRRRAS